MNDARADTREGASQMGSAEAVVAQVARADAAACRRAHASIADRLAAAGG